ncbi:MAG: hypothetical protein FJY88_11690 [Candidatus Eisenbacteria bacterium]|nr:hypothetical protein [Candidatus Eisenbacteria bacterium]
MMRDRLLALAIAGVALIGLSCGDNGNGGPTVPQEPPPRAPSSLRVTATSATGITISWQDRSSDETGFRIERSVGNAGSFAKQDTVPRNITTYTDRTEIIQGQTYYYRVLSYIRASFSEPSESVWAIAATNQTPRPPVAVTPPNGARDVPIGALTLRWTASDPDAGDLLLYDVYWGTARNDMRLIAEAASATEVAAPEEIALNAHYFWQVKARDSKGAMGVGPIWGFNSIVERVTFPGGWLVMGDAREFVHPGNPVWVEPFEMDRYEITNQQFADWLNEVLRIKTPGPLVRTSGGAVYDPGGVTLYAETVEMDDDSQISYDSNDSLFTVVEGKESFPVVEVTWHGANAYARYFGRRLPLEAEWEFAARGNSTEFGDSLFTAAIRGDETLSVRVGLGTTYPWGQEADASRANFEGSGDPYESQTRVLTSPVGFFNGELQGGFQTGDGSTPVPPGETVGVHDLAGNVWEWCDDWYREYTRPHSPPSIGNLKIIRGGGWNRGPGSMQTWRRSIVRPETPDRALGFRTCSSAK